MRIRKMMTARKYNFNSLKCIVNTKIRHSQIKVLKITIKYGILFKSNERLFAWVE